jgi:hypothetical protein
MYGQALLDIPSIKILMGTDGKNLQETRELYNLTDAEEELLCLKADAVNIASFLKKYQEAPFISMDTLNDFPFLTAKYGFNKPYCFIDWKL